MFILKWVILFFVLVFSNVIILTGDEIYNYYARKNDGTYDLKNIEEKDISYFRYNLSLGNNQKKITGYYYKTTKIKFVDLVEHDHIISTTYYNFDNTILYQRKNSYKDNKIVLSVIECKNGYLNFSSNIIFSYDSDGINLQSNRIIETKTESTYLNISFISSTYLYDFQHPVSSTSIAVANSNDSLFTNNIREEYDFSDGNITSYKIINLDNNVTVYIKKFVYNNDRIENILEERFDDNGNLISRKTIYFNDDSINETIFVLPDFKSVQNYKINNIDEDLSFICYNDSYIPSYFLRSQDENVSFKLVNMKIIPWTTSLNFKLDPFFEFPFILNKYNGARIIINQ
jgi:hypothetical protein